MDRMIAAERKRSYRYEDISLTGLMDDIMSFHGGPTPGETVPEFDLLTTDGKRVRRDDYVGVRPLLITFASLTCPMTASASAPLKRLFERFGGGVGFLSVYVREAYPGDRLPQAGDRDQKINYAHRYQHRDAIPWAVAVDSLEGDFHRAMGAHPNACYIIDERGTVAFRALGSSDEAAIRLALEALVSGRTLKRRESRSRALPFLASVGCMNETLEQAGPKARRQMLRQAPPLYGLGRLAGLFTPLPPAGRGIAALGVVGLGVTALVKALSRDDLA